MSVTKVLCPGSFDPITNGHLDIIKRARDLFGHVVVGVGTNSQKKYAFGDDRLRLVREAVAGLEGVEVGEVTGLVVDFCREHGIDLMVKGMRFASDFDFELQQAHMNHGLTGVETIFLPASRDYVTVSSTLIRAVMQLGGDVSGYVPPNVQQAIAARRQAH